MARRSRCKARKPHISHISLRGALHKWLCKVSAKLHDRLQKLSTRHCQPHEDVRPHLYKSRFADTKN
jgi:hypothetical protein